jgi:protein TonB
MTRRITIARALLVALALVTAVSSCAQKTPRIRLGGEGQTEASAPTKRVAAVYPEQAKADKIQGSVLLEIVIGTDGKVIQTAVKKSVPGLDEAAVNAVRQWEYKPTIHNGKPAEVIVNVTVNFALN